LVSHQNIFASDAGVAKTEVHKDRLNKGRHQGSVPQELWTAVSITALAQEVVSSQDAGALHKMSESTPFLVFLGLPKNQPTPQSGDTRRSPKVAPGFLCERHGWHKDSTNNYPLQGISGSTRILGRVSESKP